MNLVDSNKVKQPDPNTILAIARDLWAHYNPQWNARHQTIDGETEPLAFCWRYVIYAAHIVKGANYGPLANYQDNEFRDPNTMGGHCDNTHCAIHAEMPR